MSELSKIVGQRIRNYRTQKGFSQEKLAELSGSLSTLFEKIDNNNDGSRNIPLECYDLIASKSKGEQEQIYRILIEMDIYKNK